MRFRQLDPKKMARAVGRSANPGNALADMDRHAAAPLRPFTRAERILVSADGSREQVPYSLIELIDGVSWTATQKAKRFGREVYSGDDLYDQALTIGPRKPEDNDERSPNLNADLGACLSGDAAKHHRFRDGTPMGMMRLFIMAEGLRGVVCCSRVATDSLLLTVEEISGRSLISNAAFFHPDGQMVGFADFVAGKLFTNVAWEQRVTLDAETPFLPETFAEYGAVYEAMRSALTGCEEPVDPDTIVRAHWQKWGEFAR